VDYKIVYYETKKDYDDGCEKIIKGKATNEEEIKNLVQSLIYDSDCYLAEAIINNVSFYALDTYGEEWKRGSNKI